MYCNYCRYKMDKLTRSHFSINTSEGACEICQGLGKVLKINKEVIREGVKVHNKYAVREKSLVNLLTAADLINFNREEPDFEKNIICISLCA